MRQLKCQRCGKEFNCGSNDGKCWCFEISYVRFDTTEKYSDCLCKECLIDIHNERSKNNNQG
jgi:hypothetical protein